MSIMPWPWQRREREADRLENLASLLDAGFDLHGGLASSGTVNRSPPPVDGGAAAALAAAGFDLDGIDRAVLETAEHSGELARALRDRSAARRTRSSVARLLVLRLAYPVIVLAMASAICAWLGVVGLGGLGWLPVVLLGIVAAVAGATAWIVRRARGDPSFRAGRVSSLASFLENWGEAPYLDAMRSLYGAGVAIDRSHELATRTVPFANLRARLTAAGSRLAERNGYVESLDAAAALSDEVRRLLVAGERAGQLEEALARCAGRQRELFEDRARRSAATIGAIAYGLAAVVVLLVVWDFYGGLWSRIGVR
jgi:type II secretory pathway component PulF